MSDATFAPLNDVSIPSISSKRRCKEPRRLSMSRTNDTSTRSMQFSTVFCTQFGCNKVHIREGHFVNQFKKNHSKAHVLMCCLCTMDFRGQGIEAFARHIWDNHMDTKGFASDSSLTHSPRQRIGLLSGLHSRILPTSSRSGFDHPAISPSQISPRLNPDLISNHAQRVEQHRETQTSMSHEPMDIAEIVCNDAGGLLTPTALLHNTIPHQDIPDESARWNDGLSAYSGQTITNHNNSDCQPTYPENYGSSWQR